MSENSNHTGLKNPWKSLLTDTSASREIISLDHPIWEPLWQTEEASLPGPLAVLTGLVQLTISSYIPEEKPVVTLAWGGESSKAMVGNFARPEQIGLAITEVIQQWEGKKTHPELPHVGLGHSSPLPTEGTAWQLSLDAQARSLTSTTATSLPQAFHQTLVLILEGLIREWEQGQRLEDNSLANIAASMYPIASFLQELQTPTTTVNALLQQQYQERANELAIITPEQQLTYGELQAQVQGLSQLLRTTYQVKPGDTVMVLTERSHWWLVAMLGTLHTGAVYLPADPSLPTERLQHYVKETSTQVVLTHSDLSGALEGVSAIKLLLDKISLPQAATTEATLAPGAPAFLLFTSGSTGTPKAVQVSHGAFAAMITDQAKAMGITKTDRIQWFSSPLYDASLLQMLLPLVVGGTSIVVPPQVGEDLSAHRQYLTKHETTVAIMPPSYLHLMDITQVPSVKKIISGGESPVPSDLERYTQSMEYFNSYGATETCVCSSLYPAHEYSGHTTRIPIGIEVANTLILMLDDALQPVPYGVIGQICVASPNLADGYPYDPALTQEKFIDHPLVPGVQVYCTGDLGVKRPDGHIEFVGRKDDQVKVRGRRIELAETEAALLKQPEVQQCVVVLHSLDIDQIQVAYITGTDDVEAVKAHAAQVLPAFQVPEVIIPMDVLPRTVQGKVDKQMLPPPFQEDSFGELEGLDMEGQDSPVAEQLVEIWRGLIQIQNFTHQDNFFDIGGTSLQIIKMFDAINLLYPDVLKVSELFDHPTLESQVQLLESKLENSLTNG